jgi:hypothetical protein
MAFTFGLGSNTLQNQYRQDVSTFKLTDISNNIQKRISSPSANAAGYLDYTASHLSTLMQQDQENDDNATFFFEYQALLRTRIQQLITDLTAALTRDLDGAMAQARNEWGGRKAMQGFSIAGGEDAGAARTSYNFMAGFANSAALATVPTDVAYTGSPTVNPDGSSTNRVSPDTSADRDYGPLRVVGTAAFQLSIPDDDVETTIPVIDSLNISTYGAGALGDNVLYREFGGGFVAHKNRYRFSSINTGNDGNSARTYDPNDPDPIDPTTASINLAQAYTTAGILYTNQSSANNLNDNNFDGSVNAVERFNVNAQNKNEFQKVLYEAIIEFDHRNILRDIFRLSDRNGFLNDVSIASTSSLNTGSQVQATIALNFVPRSTGGVVAGANTTTTSAQVTGGAFNFRPGDIVYVTVAGNKVPVTVTSVPSDTQLNFTPPLPGVPDPGVSIVTTRPDLGGGINIGMERWLAYWHSG